MAGGDDYLTKPFSYAELLGRVKAQIRRYRTYCGKPKEALNLYLEAGDIKICRDHNEFYIGDDELSLSNTEYKILLLLIAHAGQILSAEQIYEQVWEEPYFYNCNATVMTHISKLRNELSSAMNARRNPCSMRWKCPLWQVSSLRISPIIMADYMKAYAVDTLVVSFLFCFVGYFNGCGYTTFVMIQGLIGAFLVRIPISWLMSRVPDTNLFKIGLATPASTVVQIVLCAFWFFRIAKKRKYGDDAQ